MSEWISKLIIWLADRQCDVVYRRSSVMSIGKESGHSKKEKFGII